MGHKVNPKVIRIGTTRTWNSKWFSRQDYSEFLRDDVFIKKFLQTKLKEAAVDRIEIERSAGKMNIVVHSGKPGIIIGRSGSSVDDLKKQVKQKFLGSKKIDVNINIMEVKQPSLSAAINVQQIASDLEKRIPFRRALKSAMQKIEAAGAKGVKVTVSGRLNGAEIARTETLTTGNLPLHTLRADIDYSRGVARTIYGAIGIKVWIYKGEVFNFDMENKSVTNKEKKAK